MIAYDLINIKPHPHLSGHQTIQQSIFNCELFEDTSLSTIDYFFLALNSCRVLSGGWRNQLNLGIVSKCGQSRFWVSHHSIYQHWGLLCKIMDKLGRSSRMEKSRSILSFGILFLLLEGIPWKTFLYWDTANN